ncbi:Gfo/Idh/MocA family oxidoreductase [Bacillus sp. BRMEA1]|uniref:Gfo/Idh/MocA family protein n=1 Tax=Neobacillus endophyticus TaxID=2738405 RepID=UPI0015636E79|nr:Gfo/Idh/MocA family oxidoreductase [Neobacillus endophyticus]NRD78187.1 Gfo/Idh/MocA family oxidoreductase [Neobacillus endophyticus]
MKFGVIGLGDIAKKAYLPVYGGISGSEFHFYTRNQEKLKTIGEQYRFANLHHNLESLINSGIQGAFVHSSTAAHPEIVEKLLTHNIHVFVDKPIADNYAESKRLTDLATGKGLILMTGFNRRYTPTYGELKKTAEPNMVIVQKNRKGLPGEPRAFIFDDFIHVVDTMRYLFPYPIEQLLVNGRMEGDMLYHVVIQFVSPSATAIGIMNRDNGTNEEIAQVMGPHEKKTVVNVAQLTVSKGLENIEVRSDDWEPTLVKRGFFSMVEDFIQAVSEGSTPAISSQDALKTHEICEEIIGKLLIK